MATVLISGGTGMIGRELAGFLIEKGYRVMVLTRGAGSGQEGVEWAHWDPEKGIVDSAVIGRCDYVVHLAGAGVADKRWNSERKSEILESRTRSAALLVKALKETNHQVKAVISASAIGWYGPDTAESRKKGFREDAPADSHFLGETCRQWEASIQPVAEAGLRLVTLRIGIVLSESGGALKEFAKPLRFGIAAIAGNGEQVVSWIHIQDLCRMILFAMENNKISGPYNAVAPQPVTNKELVLALARRQRGKTFIPVHIPSPALKLALGEMSVEVLKSATVSSEKIRHEGFSFLYPTINAALHLR